LTTSHFSQDAPVLDDRTAPLRRLRDSGTGYKFSNLFTYFLTYS